MKFSVKLSKLKDKQASCTVIGAFQSTPLQGLAAKVDDLTQGAISKRIKNGDFKVENNETIVLYDVPGLRTEKLVVVGYGKPKDLDIKKFREACAAVIRKLQAIHVNTASLWLLSDEVKDHEYTGKARHLVESMGDTVYRFDSMKSKKDESQSINLVLNVSTQAQLRNTRQGIKQGQAINTGVTLAKNLGNLPGNVCTPSYLAQQARNLQKKYPIKTRVLGQSQMEKLGMGALLSVSRGSRQPPKLIVMEYRAGLRTRHPVVLVGKGLTFDAGGISLKPAAKMDEMKYDMCGAASVFGALVAAAELKLPLNVIGLIPSSENLPDGAANKPGDIVTSLSKKTIEVLNTDAEGRLILCDALTYAERFKPSVVIDIATLTGACVVALGNHTSGLMANNQQLADELVEAGEKSLDKAWQLPLGEDYQSQLDSNFADIANIGGPSAGAITAGCFLSRFTEDYKWAHLDIAGTAWRSGKAKGATGRVVPLLSQFLIDRSDKH
ncbi:MAG: leucyl aminopeptidase [Arenicellales bacterium]|nr:leucyl aminopeptidase [Arenicellales bacterium]